MILRASRIAGLKFVVIGAISVLGARPGVRAPSDAVSPALFAFGFGVLLIGILWMTVPPKAIAANADGVTLYSMLLPGYRGFTRRWHEIEEIRVVTRTVFTNDSSDEYTLVLLRCRSVVTEKGNIGRFDRKQLAEDTPEIGDSRTMVWRIEPVGLTPEAIEQRLWQERTGVA